MPDSATSRSSRARSRRSARSSASPTRCRTTRSSSTSRAAAPVATTRGKTSTTCCSTPTPSCAPGRTSSSASVAASAPPSGPADYLTGRLVGGTRLPGDAARRHPGRHRRDGHPRGDHLAEVKQLLVDTPGYPDWVGAGNAAGGMASGRSQLGADIHEIDNAASRTGRLLDEVAGDADAVAERRDEIIEALNGTAKPYFGDVAEMTYEQWLDRYLELAVGSMREHSTAAPTSDAITEATRALARHHLARRASARCCSAPRPGCTPPTVARSPPCSHDDGDRSSARRGRRALQSRSTRRHATAVLHPADVLVLRRAVPDPGQAGQLRARRRR